ncbi:MAG TPA: hypothetical protein VNN98_02380 [Rhizomicrobium sp.]|nr:hypothetical protein [Rhizomicrobium sp.]
MDIDPVVFLAEELRTAESALHAAVKLYEKDHLQQNGEKVNALLTSIKNLYRDIAETMPTSALGAAEMIRLAAQRLPFSMARYTTHFHDVADRLGAGRREQTDLIWLRAMRSALKSGQGGEQGQRAAPLLSLALAGAARPVVVFRAVVPPPRDDDGRIRLRN